MKHPNVGWASRRAHYNSVLVFFALGRESNSCSLLLFKTDDHYDDDDDDNYDYDDDDDDNDNDGNDDDENDDDEWLCSDICVHCIYIGRLVSSCGRLCH